MFRKIINAIRELDCQGPVSCVVNFIGCMQYRIHSMLNASAYSTEEFFQDAADAWYHDVENLTDFEREELNDPQAQILRNIS